MRILRLPRMSALGATRVRVSSGGLLVDVLYRPHLAQVARALAVEVEVDPLEGRLLVVTLRPLLAEEPELLQMRGVSASPAELGRRCGCVKMVLEGRTLSTTGSNRFSCE